jgi:RNA polymerase sigma-70 factor (ECF subfamily)
MAEDSNETEGLLERAAAGDSKSWSVLLDRHRHRLRRMVALRLDQRLQGRLDPSDVLQEVYLEAQHSLAKYFQERSLPYTWTSRNSTPTATFPELEGILLFFVLPQAKIVA